MRKQLTDDTDLLMRVFTKDLPSELIFYHTSLIYSKRYPEVIVKNIF